MHQPFYRDPMTGLYRLPWVRLHGTKDYLDMVEILREFPEIHQTFNFTPSLVEQIVEYAEHGAEDRYLSLTRKNPAHMDEEERLFLLEHFFYAHWSTMIGVFPRYLELLHKRGMRPVKSGLLQASRYFNETDLRDLQVLFNLSWTDPLFRERDPLLRELVHKGKNFTEEEKHALIDIHLSILGQIIPTYRELSRKGQIELSCSPFYHPILPLLCDTNSAKIAMPDVLLPEKRFSFPEDAETQIRMGIEYFERIFGYTPKGMWPSEGSVSPEVVRMASRSGIKWIGTDEDIFAASVGKPLRDSSRSVISPGTFYTPCAYEDTTMVFRDHILSDLIGFEYAKWNPKSAADDFIKRLLSIHSSLPQHTPHLVPVILDGENAWEHYSNDGQDFLRYLYEGISEEKRLKTVSISEYLTSYGTGSSLERLHTGSWIYANFSIWIGHEEDNRAWDYLTETRNDLETYQRTHPEKDCTAAWKALYIAEGSDWNWWYGDDHSTDTQKDFDELFRFNLMKVYQETGKKVPSFLFVPVLREDRSISPTTDIRGFIDPVIDGTVTNYYEWYQAAYLDVTKHGGSMHKSESFLSYLYYGFNKDNLFIRLDPGVPFSNFSGETRISIEIIKPIPMKIVIIPGPDLNAGIFEEDGDTVKKVKDIPDVAIRDIFEIRIPFTDMHAHENDEINLAVSLLSNGDEIERCPSRGHISVIVPSPHFEALMWS